MEVRSARVLKPCTLAGVSLLDVFKHAFATSNQGVGPQQVAKAVGGIAAAMEAYSSDHSRALLTHIIVPWAIQVVQLAPVKWVLPASVPPSCAFLHDNGVACGSFAVGGCHVCGRPICLSHSLIAGDATIVCWTCMRLAAKHATKWAPPASASSPSTTELGWAYELLGLEPSCTLAEAKRA